MITVTRYHDFSCAHRAPNDLGKCNNIHGHNYRVYFTFGLFNGSHDDTLGSGVNHMGRVFDFGLIKSLFCEWLEKNWDHRLLVWEHDVIWFDFDSLSAAGSPFTKTGLFTVLLSSFKRVSFDTSTENMANWLLKELGPEQLKPYKDVSLIKVHIEETTKCSATASFS